jgi:HD-GYP domain-containing protein (c-di-GMP phosphodiesterase class II)
VKTDGGQTQPLIIALATALHARALYPREHPRVVSAARDVCVALGEVLRSRRSEEFTILVVDDLVVIDDRPVRSGSIYMQSLVRILNRFGVQRMTLGLGLDEREVRGVLDGLSSAGELASSPHFVLGRVQAGGGPGGGGAGGRVDLREEHVDAAEEAYRRFSNDRRGSVEALDRMVWQFMEGLASAGRSMLLLAPIRDFDQHTFIHSVNTALLVLAQGRSLGLRGDALHEIGVAALLHDIGKLSLPRGILEARGRLSDEQWEIARQHPEIGASQLCGVPNVPPLAVLVAYEHHLRWDGAPSYPAVPVGRRPNFASQLVAVADTYDSMVAGRGAATPVREAGLRVWRERAGTFLDPMLAGNFVLMMAEADSSAAPATSPG